MGREPVPLDISDTSELFRLAQEVHATRRPRVLRHHGEEVAVLMPPRPRRTVRSRPQVDGPRVSRSVRRSLALVERGAGMLKRYAASPPLTVEEEREAFEREVAQQVVESMGE